MDHNQSGSSPSTGGDLAAPLSAEQLATCLREIISGQVPPSLIGSFLVALQCSRVIESSPRLLLSCAEAMESFAVPCEDLSEGGTVKVLDVVGTGGDGYDTFNISTAAAFVVASSGKCRVAKHGNRSSSGRCGSADLIEALGAPLHLSSEQLCHAVKKCGFGFLFAQSFHPAMKSVGMVRKEIGVRTVFNLLGPLVNPARPTHMLVGVGHASLAPLYAAALQQKEHVKRAMVVHSYDGLDEITPCGATKVWMIEEEEEEEYERETSKPRNKSIREWEIHPKDFGLEACSPDDIAGDTPSKNAEMFLRFLRSTSSQSEEGNGMKGLETFFLLNVGAALFVLQLCDSMSEGVRMARDLLRSGRTLDVVRSYVKLFS
ncbi:anthranilate phosphoribosyltransferase [Balamuthia mandrillaris]